MNTVIGCVNTFLCILQGSTMLLREKKKKKKNYQISSDYLTKIIQ